MYSGKIKAKINSIDIITDWKKLNCEQGLNKN
jgi:hypothetical protein